MTAALWVAAVNVNHRPDGSAKLSIHFDPRSEVALHGAAASTWRVHPGPPDMALYHAAAVSKPVLVDHVAKLIRSLRKVWTVQPSTDEIGEEIGLEPMTEEKRRGKTRGKDR